VKNQIYEKFVVTKNHTLEHVFHFTVVLLATGIWQNLKGGEKQKYIIFSQSVCRTDYNNKYYSSVLFPILG
jgi:hypothetical protein